MERLVACRSAGRQRFGICVRVRQVVRVEATPGECLDGTSGSGRSAREASWISRSAIPTSEPIGGPSDDRGSPVGESRQGPPPPVQKLLSGRPGWRRGSAPPGFPAGAKPIGPVRFRIPPRPEGKKDCGSSLSRQPGQGPDATRDWDSERGAGGVFRAGAGDAGPRQQAPAPKTKRRNQPSRRFPPGCRQAGRVPTLRVPYQETFPGSGWGFGEVFAAWRGHRELGIGRRPGHRTELGRGFVVSRLSLGGHQVQGQVSTSRFRRAGFDGQVFNREIPTRGIQRIWRRNSTTLPRIRQEPGGGRRMLKSGFSGRSSIPPGPR